MVGGARVAISPADHSTTAAPGDPVLPSFFAQYGFARGPLAEHARIQVLLRTIAFTEDVVIDQAKIDEVLTAAWRGHRELRFDLNAETMEVEPADTLEWRIRSGVGELDDATQPTHATRARRVPDVRAHALPPFLAHDFIDHPLRKSL